MTDFNYADIDSVPQHSIARRAGGLVPIPTPDDALDAPERDYLNGLDQRSANLCLERMGEEFGFPTAEVGGVRYMLSKDLALIGYGYPDQSGLFALVKRCGLDLITINGAEENLRDILWQAFSLSPLARAVSFATWEHVILVGKNGMTVGAREIWAYIQRAEKWAREANLSLQETGYVPDQIKAGMPQTGLTSMQKAEVKEFVKEVVTELVPTVVRETISGLRALPNQNTDIVATALGFWRSKQCEGYVSPGMSVARSLGGRVKGQGQGKNIIRYPVSALEDAFTQMIHEGLVFKPRRGR